MYIKRPFSRHRIVHTMNSCVLLSSMVFGLSLGTFFSSTWGVSAQTIITQKWLNARRLAQERDGSHNPYETLKVCWEHASPLGLNPLRNETREGVRSMQHYNTMRARPFPPLHIMVSSLAISEDTARGHPARRAQGCRQRWAFPLRRQISAFPTSLCHSWRMAPFGRHLICTFKVHVSIVH
jgi:hypothetical protein